MSPDMLPEMDVNDSVARASAFVDAQLKNDLVQDYVIEAGKHAETWADFRPLLVQPFRVYRRYGTAQLELDDSGSVTGFTLNIAAGKSAALPAGSMPLAHFFPEIPDSDKDLALPAAMRGIPTVLPFDTEKMGEIEQTVWRSVTEELEQRGSDLALNPQELLRVTPLAAFQDSSGRRVYYVRLWVFHSDGQVTQDRNAGEIVSWYLSARHLEEGTLRLSEDEARQVAEPEMRAVKGVQGPLILLHTILDVNTAIVTWWHQEKDILIEGDHTTVMMNATTGKIFSVARKWREVAPDLMDAVSSDEEQAVRAADCALGCEAGAPVGRVLCQSVIELAREEGKPGPGRDVLVWKVGYQHAETEPYRNAEVAVSCASGQVVRVVGR